MQVARINALGMSQIAEALGQYHRLDLGHFTQPMINAWAQDAEGHFNSGQGCYFEIRGFDSNTGAPVEVIIAPEGYDVESE